LAAAVCRWQQKSAFQPLKLKIICFKSKVRKKPSLKMRHYLLPLETGSKLIELFCPKKTCQQKKKKLEKS